jgi:hypothetical protein
MVYNYVNHPSLLEATPIGELWNCQASSELHPDLGISIQHLSQVGVGGEISFLFGLFHDFLLRLCHLPNLSLRGTNANSMSTKTILVTDPAYPELFQQTGLDGMPNLHHVTFTIGTRIADRQEGRAHEILLAAKGYDSADNVLPCLYGNHSGYCGGLDFWMDMGGWAGEPVDQLLPIVKDIFGDWKCVVEYLKYMIELSESHGPPLTHPLIHMNILGDGLAFRRATLRISGSIVSGIVIRN